MTKVCIILLLNATLFTRVCRKTSSNRLFIRGKNHKIDLVNTWGRYEKSWDFFSPIKVNARKLRSGAVFLTVSVSLSHFARPEGLPSHIIIAGLRSKVVVSWYNEFKNGKLWFFYSIPILGPITGMIEEVIRSGDSR